MSVDTRMEIALDHAHAAKKEIERASEHPDPVEQRRAMVRAAVHYRRAADELDDQRRLEE
jgi:hypothetical protein